MSAGPAAAHVEVSAEGAQAGTGPVTLIKPGKQHLSILATLLLGLVAR
jgi:hypothetical protein